MGIWVYDIWDLIMVSGKSIFYLLKGGGGAVDFAKALNCLSAQTVRLRLRDSDVGKKISRSILRVERQKSTRLALL